MAETSKPPQHLWTEVCRHLQEDESITASRQALLNFSLTCKLFNTARKYLPKRHESIRAGRLLSHPHLITELKLSTKRLPELTVVTSPDIKGIITALEQLGRLKEISLDFRMLSYRVLRAIAKKQGLKKLTIRNCEINSKNRKNEEQTQACNSLFEKSSLEVLDLAYYHLPSGKGRPVNPFFARLAFIPSLEIMNTTTISFRAIGNLSDMPAIPKLKVLRIVPTFHEAPLVQRLHLSSFLSRCSQLESLYIDERIRLDEDEDQDEEKERAAQTPELQTYEGPSWPLSLLRAPRLQRVVVTRLRWDEGALINALASMSSNLKTLVVELAVTLDDPRMKVIDNWVDWATARPIPKMGDNQRFSLIIRAAQREEWEYAARAGMTCDGVVAIESLRRHCEVEALAKTAEK